MRNRGALEVAPQGETFWILEFLNVACDKDVVSTIHSTDRFSWASVTVIGILLEFSPEELMLKKISEQPLNMNIIEKNIKYNVNVPSPTPPLPAISLYLSNSSTYPRTYRCKLLIYVFKKQFDDAMYF